MKPVGTSMIFINRADQVLLALRDDIPTIAFPNCWDILGGHPEEGELPEACIIREIKEEIDIQLVEPRRFRIYDLPDRTEHTFWQRTDLDLGRINLREGQRLQWFSQPEIVEMAEAKIAFGFKSILLEFLQASRFL